ncbi:hypothetical protein SAMN05444365_11453 [Micromonospora pattaloongensis]|uniref:Uncharacterized protein n=1 Tax=Micromonospora pattaloongensis TaxID=405436 RepID=A0A1H3SVQ7_9ACTN|nr:hypothetical protein [Micromonospora pattaloongensis]SDZ41615.1 hypothetical protein SAMN05444365_11453 [Micromonospora pattaloongensis]
MADPERRRRRLRHSPPGGVDDAGDRFATTADVNDPEPTAGRSRRGGGAAGASAEEREAERGLRGLVGSGASQVSVTAALRARDAARPSDADLAEAEQRLVVVRRNWVPREELPRSGR